MPPSQVGRPEVITKDTVLKLEQAYQNGFSVMRACQLSGISRSTYYKHLKEQPEFSDKMTLAQQYPAEVARQSIVKAISNGDIGAAKWWLERKAKDEFGVKADIQLATDVQEVSSLDYIKEIAEAIREANKEKLPNAPAAFQEQ